MENQNTIYEYSSLRNLHIKDQIVDITKQKTTIGNNLAIHQILRGLGIDPLAEMEVVDNTTVFKSRSNVKLIKNCLESFFDKTVLEKADLEGNLASENNLELSITTTKACLDTKGLVKYKPVFMFSDRKGVPPQFLVSTKDLTLDIESSSEFKIKDFIIIVLWENIQLISLTKEEVGLLEGLFYEVEKQTRNATSLNEKYKLFNRPTAGNYAYLGLGALYKYFIDTYESVDSVVLNTYSSTDFNTIE